MNSDSTIRNIQILKTMIVISGIILILAGIVMIFMDIRSEGNIFIKTPVVEGSISATYVGLFVIFLGVVLELGAILKPYRFSKKKKIIESPGIESPDLKIIEQEETGMCHPLGDGDCD